MSEVARRFKVLFLTPWYPNSAHPGDGIFIREHGRAVSLYDDVRVLHCPWPQETEGPAWKFEMENDPALAAGLPTYRVQTRRWPLPRTSDIVHYRGIRRAWDSIVSDGFRPDLLHAHIYIAGFPAALLSRRHGVPFVVSEHFSHFPRRLLSRWDVWKSRYTFNAAARVMPVSRALCESIQRYGIKAEFEVVRNVVDTQLFRPTQAPRNREGLLRLLYVGSLIPVKGLGILVEALAQFTRTHADWRLDLVGDGALREQLQHRVTEKRLASRVTFHGHQPKTVVAQFMREADYLVLPSLYETLSCVALEAMASGLPVVATRTGGVPEIVPEQAGILVPVNDASAFSKGLQQALQRRATYDPRQIAALVEPFRPESIGRQLHVLYNDVLSEAKGARAGDVT